MGASLSVQKTVNNVTIFPGDTVIYTIIVTNNGAGPFDSVTLQDVNIIPNSVITNVTTTQGTIATIGQTVNVTITDFAPSETATITITIQTTNLTPPGDYINTATANGFADLGQGIELITSNFGSATVVVQENNLTLIVQPINISCGLIRVLLTAFASNGSSLIFTVNPSIAGNVIPVNTAAFNSGIVVRSSNILTSAIYQSSGFIGNVVITVREARTGQTAQITIQQLPNCCINIL